MGNAALPVGKYDGTATDSGAGTAYASIVIVDGSHADISLKLESVLYNGTNSCPKETYAVASTGAITLPACDCVGKKAKSKGDCLANALARDSFSIDSIQYDAVKDAISLRMKAYGFIAVDFTLTKKSENSYEQTDKKDGAGKCIPQIDQYACADKHGFCVGSQYQKCDAGFLCSPSFHKSHPEENPCTDVRRRLLRCGEVELSM